MIHFLTYSYYHYRSYNGYMEEWTSKRYVQASCIQVKPYQNITQYGEHGEVYYVTLY